MCQTFTYASPISTPDIFYARIFKINTMEKNWGANIITCFQAICAKAKNVSKFEEETNLQLFKLLKKKCVIYVKVNKECKKNCEKKVF